MRMHSLHAPAGSGGISGLLRALVGLTLFVAASVLAFFTLLLSLAVALGVLLAMRLRTLFSGSRTPPPTPRAPESADPAEEPQAEDTVGELERFHGSLDEFMRGRGERGE